MSKIIYQLTYEDVQNVAMELLDRELSKAEIKQIEDKIADRISWYDAIAETIEETYGNEIENDDDDE